MKFGTKLGLFGVVALSALIAADPAAAQAPAPAPANDYHLEQQDLGDALRAVGRISGREIIFSSDLVEGKRAPHLEGTLTAAMAIDRLLAGSGLTAIQKNGSIFIRGRSGAPESSTGEAELETRDIVITGSLIPGAASASPLLVQTQQQMMNAGQHSLADAMRSIPQNFGGGQNPGVGFNVPESNGLNLGGASTVNLRGLGPDATLTLLNGHRLAYNVINQAIDIAAIPFGAVDRIEVVTDGSSALYGSDAIAGVANIILKRDFDGLMTSARFGASTDGGNTQQQYGMTAGTRWDTGGLLIAYEFERDTPILARQRSYAADRSPGLDLFPALKHHNAIMSGHQALGETVVLEADILYNKRWNSFRYALDSSGNYLRNGGLSLSESESFAIAPALRWTISDRWRASLTGMYGRDRTFYGSDNYTLGVPSYTRGCYCNAAQSVELATDGVLFSLPAGDAKIALGGGFRANDFHGYRAQGSALNVKVRQDSYYGYGEISLPVLAPGMSRALGYRATVSGALRYENYPGIGDVLTPKLGLVYAPIPDIDLKLSWGRSFRAPTLYQQYNVQSANIYTAASRGGTGYPSTASIISLAGGNPDLKPERAESWTATLAVHPRAVDGLRIEMTYFSTRYRDRVVAPIVFGTQALSNPFYREFVTFNPTDAQKQAVIANAGRFSNNLGRPYVASDVVAIVDNRSINAATQSINGVDASLDYEWDLGVQGTLSTSASMSYIDSTQQLSSLQPELQRAGTLFNPPHLRGRAGLIWSTEGVTLSSFVNHIGGVDDVRTTPGVAVGSMTTIDLTARVRIDRGPAIFRNVDITVSALNLFNVAPDLIRITQPYEAPYDSTNYAPVGRFISFGISKTW